MVIRRYIVTICTAEDECEYTENMIASYVQEGITSDSESGVTAAVVDAEYDEAMVISFDNMEDS